MNVLQILPDLNAGGVERTVLETVEYTLSPVADSGHSPPHRRAKH